MFDPYLTRWDLVPELPPSSRLLPVRHQGTPAMLKIATESDERRGSLLIVWWRGEGTARVLAHDGDAMLLERATGTGVACRDGKERRRR
jgi:streptomycin 6-kinase